MAGLSREGITMRWIVFGGLEAIAVCSRLCIEIYGDSLEGMTGMKSIDERDGWVRRLVRSNAWQNASCVVAGPPSVGTWLLSPVVAGTVMISLT